MANKDIIEKKYFKNNTRFSNIFNFYLYDGKKIIKEDNLRELDTKLVLTSPVLSNRERDIYKKAVIKTDGKFTYLLLGIENQTKEDSTMVIRNMIYDSMSYYNQLEAVEKNKNFDKIKVINY